MWSSHVSETEAAAAFTPSSDDECASQSGLSRASPSGLALRKAHVGAENESMFFTPFDDSPPSKQNAASELQKLDASRHGGPSAGSRCDLCDDVQEAALLAQIAKAAAVGPDDLDESDGDLMSGSSGSDPEYSCSENERASRPLLMQCTPQLKFLGRKPLLLDHSSSCSKGGQADYCLSSVESSTTPSTTSYTSLSAAQALQVIQESKGQLKGKLEKQRLTHAALCSTAFCEFQCDCPAAAGRISCLDTGFDRGTFRSYHFRTYGRGKELHTLAQVKTAVHEYVWELRQPLPEARGQGGPHFHIPTWRLGGAQGQIVCRKAFAAVIGGTKFAHRQALTLTIAGRAPSDQKAYKVASKALVALDTTASPKTEWAKSWWRKHLMYQDWLPNEVKIQYRGPTWTVVYNTLYEPVAKLTGMTLKPKQWMRCRSRALEAMHNAFPPNVHHMKLNLVRAARHSKFPECTDCQRLRERYREVASDSKSTEVQVAQAYQALIEHAKLWQGDRETALDLRHRYSVLSSFARYFVDDKCGSFWQMLPVSATGRDTKENAKARYKFCVHANVVCGEAGHKIFTFVPKNIGTGTNFGLTNLLMSIFLAARSGNLKPHTDTLVRHTDGGPDNVSVVTHVIHWLLVYLGVFNKVVWFRFKAGHSHTEVADRLFSTMKTLFESDAQHRVLGVEDFPALAQKISDAFHKEVESCTFNWNFANWDLRTMVNEMNIASSTFKGITSKMVYQYTYDENLWEHGCVLVQYKSNINWKGSSREAEWSPIVRVERQMNIGSMDDEAQTVECNISRPKGVRFITKPPDLRILPRREPFEQLEEKSSPAQQAKSVLNKRWEDLSPSARSFWKCLSMIHSEAGDVAEQMPEMPHTVHTDERSFTFDGTPRPFVDVMKGIMLRFPRPLLPPDPFSSKPAETWEAAKGIRDSRVAATSLSIPASGSGEDESAADTPELRDPRKENTVMHMELTEAEKRRYDRELAEEEFATTTPSRVEAVEIGQLYLCELEVAERGLRLGLCIPEKEGPVNDDGRPTWQVAWFKISSKNGWKTKNIAFKPHKNRAGRRATDQLDIRSFRLRIEDSDLTKAGKANKDSNPKFTGGFTEKVLAFARNEELDTDDEMDIVESDGEDDDVEELEAMEEEEHCDPRADNVDNNNRSNVDNEEQSTNSEEEEEHMDAAEATQAVREGKQSKATRVDKSRKRKQAATEGRAADRCVEDAHTIDPKVMKR